MVGGVRGVSRTGGVFLPVGRKDGIHVQAEIF